MQEDCVAKRRGRDDDEDLLGKKRTRYTKQVPLPSKLDIHSAFRLYCISKPNEHDFKVLLDGALRCYCPGVMERARSLVYVKFDDQFFSDAPDRAHELVDATLFDEFSKLYKNSDKPVPLHGVAFRGFDLHIQFHWLVSKVIDGRVDPVALVWEAVAAGFALPVDAQLRWAVDRYYQAVTDMCF